MIMFPRFDELCEFDELLELDELLDAALSACVCVCVRTCSMTSLSNRLMHIRDSYPPSPTILRLHDTMKQLLTARIQRRKSPLPLPLIHSMHRPRQGTDFTLTFLHFCNTFLPCLLILVLTSIPFVLFLIPLLLCYVC